ncbi:MAG: uridine kinase [Planctomycetales bacterium]|nr:uridine kinase [Planctomycetales bacterium]
MKIVGIAGGSGSGKSTICQQLVRAVNAPCAVITHDSYYRCLKTLSLTERQNVNFDHPDALETELLCHHIDQLCDDEAIEIPEYCFATHTRLPSGPRISPKPILFVEGVLTLCNTNLRARFDVSVFVHADDTTRLERRKARDVLERGRTAESVLQQWEQSVLPMHQRFVEPSRHHADVVIDNHETPNLEPVLRILRRLHADD